MNCENCEHDHDGTYGSGRFCSTKCGKGFSTKAKRKEINKKVSASLQGRGHHDVKLTCLVCKDMFEVGWARRGRKTCSRACSHKLPITEKTREKLSKARIKAIIDGKTNHAGTKCQYDFRGKLIQCDSKIEYACCNFFEAVYDATNIERCTNSIEYMDGKTKRQYLPDFIIDTPQGIFIVECKSYASSNILNEKWRRYNELAVLKKEVLVEYASKNGIKSFWFTKDLHGKYYSQLKF